MDLRSFPSQLHGRDTLALSSLSLPSFSVKSTELYPASMEARRGSRDPCPAESISRVPQLQGLSLQLKSSRRLHIAVDQMVPPL